jgi:hypothetical protein
MEQNIIKPKRHTYSVKSPSRGGARAGSGRPKGSTNKIRMEELLEKIELRTGQDYATQLANNYAEAIQREDWRLVNDYDKVFLAKVVADKQEIEVINAQDTIEARAQAFAEALASMAKNNNNNNNNNINPAIKVIS